MKNYTPYLSILLCLSLFISCNKTYDEPPVTEIPIGDIISISGLKDSLSAIKNNRHFFLTEINKDYFKILKDKFGSNLFDDLKIGINK